MEGFISALISALIQLILFALIPFIWWLATGREQSFFEWMA